MNDIEKIIYVLKASLHSLPNDAALTKIAEVILDNLDERCDFDCDKCRED